MALHRRHGAIFDAFMLDQLVESPYLVLETVWLPIIFNDPKKNCSEHVHKHRFSLFKK